MRSVILAVMLLLGCAGLRAGVEEREDVTFILGCDEDPSSPMFGLAEKCSRASSAMGAASVVSSLRSLSEVRAYLASHPPRNGRPWGLVQLVVHGNGGCQLALPIVPGGEDLMPSSLAAAVDRGSFQPLPDTLLDAGSELRILGCALGRNGELLRALSRALGGNDSERPLVRASRYYTCYQAVATRVSSPTRFLSEAWRFVHPLGQAPSLEAMQAKIRAEHPGLELDVAEALTRTSPRFPGDTFSSRGPASYHWTRIFRRPEDCPVLTDRTRLLCWLRELVPFSQHLDQAGLCLDSMDWTAHHITRTLDGCERPSVKVEGTGEAIYIMRALTLEPSWDDPAYFTSER